MTVRFDLLTFGWLVVGPSSVVPGSRNPMWGEEFDFYAEDLPVTVRCNG